MTRPDAEAGPRPLTEPQAVDVIASALHDVTTPECHLADCRGGVVHKAIAEGLIAHAQRAPGSLLEYLQRPPDTLPAWPARGVDLEGT